MNQRYESRKEYSLMDVLQYNLRKWWLAAVFAAVFAVIVGGYKAKTLMPYIDAEVYDDRMQVETSVLLKDYNSGSTVERGNDIITFYVVYPRTSWDYTVNDEEEAYAFVNGLLQALDTVTKKQVGTQCFTVFDEPQSQREVTKLETYTISSSEFRQGVLKAVIAGILLGIMLEVVLYTLWMMIYKKPKDAQEVQECLETQIVDVITKKNEDEETYKKAAMFLNGQKAEGCLKINCLPVGRTADTTALRLAMCYANEKKKTLLIDLNATDSDDASLSAYVMGNTTELKLQQMNDYLDTVKRNLKQEQGFDLVGNEKFKELLDRFSKQYEYILVNGRDVPAISEGYQTALLCDSNLVICGRRNVRTEELYMLKNTAEINHIHLDGVLVYDL